MSMFEKINKVVDERYLDGDHITLYDKDGKVIYEGKWKQNQPD